MNPTLKTPDFGCVSNELDRNFGLIRDYLDDSACNSETTATQLLATLDPNSTEPSLADGEIEGFLWSLWAMVVKMVQQIPATHPWQDKIVDLLRAIQELPRPCRPDADQIERKWGYKFWHNLPIFSAEMRETWNRGPWEKRLNPDLYDPGDAQFAPDVWANLNAFAARLTTASVSNFESYIIWLLRHTLEEERLDKELDWNIPAAATWIIYAGRFIYDGATKEQGRSSETHQLDLRYLRRFKKQFSKERWDFWMETFEWVKENGNLKQETRNRAKDALERIIHIEGTEGELRAERVGPHASER